MYLNGGEHTVNLFVSSQYWVRNMQTYKISVWIETGNAGVLLMNVHVRLHAYIWQPVCCLLQRVGCDRVLGSTAALDMCGVCNGNNSTCKIYKGQYTKQHYANRKNSKIPIIAYHFCPIWTFVEHSWESEILWLFLKIISLCFLLQEWV